MNEWANVNFQGELERIQQSFSFDFVGIALIQSPDRNFELRWTNVVGNRSERYRRIVLQSGKGVAGLVFKTGKPIYVGDAEKDLSPDDLFNYPIITTEKLKSFGAVPLYKYNRVKGVLLVGFRTKRKLTETIFEQFKETIKNGFGPFYDKEMVKE